MSLNMYLRKKVYPSINYKDYVDNKITAKVVLETDYSTLTSFEVNPSTSFQLGEVYWGKANMIHDWFVNEVQYGNDDCSTYVVSEDNLKDLLNTCEEILEEKELNGKDSAILLAEEILPTTDSFFFGNTEYEDYYFNTLEKTITDVKSLINIGVPKKIEGVILSTYYEYSSSW